jgi:hypothetical protein
MLYVDPSAGSIALQVAVAAMVAGLLFVKRWWSAVTDAIRGGLHRFRRR